MKNHLKRNQKLAVTVDILRVLASHELRRVGGGDGGVPSAGIHGYGGSCSFNIVCKQN